MAELYYTFQRLSWNSEEFERLLHNTTILMEETVSTDILVRELFNKLPNDSPISNYQMRIYRTYKNNKEIIYKPEADGKKKRLSLFTISMLPFALIAAYSVGFALELILFTIQS